MSIKIFINETDDEKVRASKVRSAITEYGKVIYEKCMTNSYCSDDAKKYITPGVCHQFVSKGLSKAIFDSIPAGQEFEIHINPGHVMRVIKYAENKLQQEKAKQHLNAELIR